MFGLLDRKQPLLKVNDRLNRVIAEVGRLTSRLRKAENNPQGQVEILRPLSSSIQEMRGDVEAAVRQYRRSRKVDHQMYSTIRRDLGNMGGTLKAVRENLFERTGRASRKNNLLKPIYRAVGKLDEAMQDLKREAAGQEDQHFSKEFPEVYRSVLSLSHGKTKNLSVEYLISLLRCLPGIDPRDLKDARSLALIYLLDRYPGQGWDVRYIAKTPGRYLVPVITLGSFPTPEFVDHIKELYGADKEYCVAAILPKWRLVWKLESRYKRS